MDIVTPQTRELAGDGAPSRIEQLLRNYPDVSPAERAEILHFDKKAPFLEKGRISMDDALRSRLERFRADNAADYRMSLRDWLIVAAVVAALAATFLFLSDLYVS